MATNCEHLLMPAGRVRRAALGKCLWEHLCKHAHPWGGSAKGWLTPNPRPPYLRYCSHVNGSVRQYPVFLTSWTRPEAPWHPEPPNTSPPRFKNTHTPLFLAPCNPLIISVRWIWDDYVLKVLRRAGGLRYRGTARKKHRRRRDISGRVRGQVLEDRHIHSHSHKYTHTCTNCCPCLSLSVSLSVPCPLAAAPPLLMRKTDKC